MVHKPNVYMDLIGSKITRHCADCWFLNTGWVGGPYGVGERISIGYSRAILDAVLDGELLAAQYWKDEVFQYQIPKTCRGVPDKILNPVES